MYRLKSKKFWIIIVLALIVVLVGSWSLWKKNQSNRPTYSLFTVKGEAALVLQGKVNATDQRLVKAHSNGELTKMFVHDGDTVEQGQQIFELTDDTKNTDVNVQTQDNQAAQQKINNLQDELSKAQKNGDDSQIDEIKNELVDANNALSDGQLKYNELSNQATQIVTAPINGVVHVVDKNGGSNVSNIYIISKDKVIKGKVSEFDLNKVHEKQSAQVTSDVTNKKYHSKVTNLSSVPTQADTTDRTDQQVSYYQFNLKDSSDDPVGTDVHIRIPQAGIEIPKHVIFNQHGLQYVYVYQKQRAHKKEISTVTKNGITYLSAGLKKGQKLVVNPTHFKAKSYPESVKINVN